MRLSNERREELYRAVSEPIMDKRIAVKKLEHILGPRNIETVDQFFYDLEIKIIREIRKALNIEL